MHMKIQNVHRVVPILLTGAGAIVLALSSLLLSTTSMHAQAAVTDAPPIPQDSAMPVPSGGALYPFTIITATTSVDVVSGAAQTAGPSFDIWYGDTQTFGNLGNATREINILGNVSGNAAISSLTYKLNGVPKGALSLGPDSQRLADAGDFNVEIPLADLVNGNNTLVLTAIDANGIQTNKTVTVAYTANHVWPLPVTTNWNSSTDIQDVAQAIDGLWTMNSGSNTVTAQQLAYDRLLAIGDLSWSDYEVTVPVTVRAIDVGGYAAPSNGPGIGLLVRWRGHTETTPGEQPKTYWRTNLGALAWYRWWRKDGSYYAGFKLQGGGGTVIDEDSPKILAFNTTYNLKVRVESIPNQKAYYWFKIWEQGTSEPATWDLEGQGTNGETAGGSVVLVAHHVDADFGPVTITPISAQRYTVSTSVSGSGVVSKAPNQADYALGDQVTLTAIPTPGYIFTGWSGDIVSASNPLNFSVAGNTAVTANFVLEQGQTQLTSDDFNRCTLNNQIWTYVDPQANTSGASTLTATGYGIEIAVPAGIRHDVWTNSSPTINAPQLLQPINDTDFDLEVAFESTIDLATQMQGVLIKESDTKFLRVNYQRSGPNDAFRLLGFKFTNATTASKVIDQPWGENEAHPRFLRIKRTGDNWTVYYRVNAGDAWTAMPGFSFALNVANGGLFAGNSGSYPGFTMKADYVFNAEQPIVPEDRYATRFSDITAAVDPASQGTIAGSSGCALPLSLTATPVVGWSFSHWESDTLGSDESNPVTASFARSENVTAFFTQNRYTLNTQINSQGVGVGGTIVKTPNQATYLHGTTVQLAATPSSGWSFTGWTGAVTSSNAQINVVMDGNKTLTATFVQDSAPSYTLTVNTAGTASGSVTRAPDKATYIAGELVTLTANPGANAQFAGWSGAVTSSSNPVTVAMDADKVITATFDELQVNEYVLTITTNGTGSGSVARDPDKQSYTAGETVELTAQPAADALFAGWSGAVSGTSVTASVVMDGNKSVVATFDQATVDRYALNVLTAGDGSGTIRVTPDQETYRSGESVTLVAQAAQGSCFVGWGGDAAGDALETQVLMDADKQVVGAFVLGTENCHRLEADVQSAGVGSGGTVEFDPARHLYDTGETVEVTAVPNPGWVFSGWAGALSGTDNPATLQITADAVIIALFTQQTYTISTVVQGNGTISVEPEGPYLLGESTTLQAVPTAGWRFVGWEGDVTSSANPVQVSVDDSMIIIAVFAEGDFKVYMPLVSKQ